MASISYTGGGRAGDWSDPANWKGRKVPGAPDKAVLLNTASGAVTSPVAVNAIMILGQETITFDGAVTTYGVGNCQGLMVCDNAVAVFAPGSSLTDGGVLQAGVDAAGTLVAQGSSTHATLLHAKTLSVGKEAPATGVVTIDGATLTLDESATVGGKGHGTLTVSDGGQVTVGGAMVVGNAAGATGSVTVATGGTITVDKSVRIGGSGTATIGAGTLTVDAGATFNARTLLDVHAGSTVVLAGGTLAAGGSSSGLVVRAGAVVSGDGTIATRQGGAVFDDGTIAATGSLTIGGALVGKGALTIGADSTAAITGKTVSVAQISFAGSDATLALAHGAAVRTTLSGFAAGDGIAMAGIDAASWNPAAGLLTLSGGGHVVDRLHLAGSYAGDIFGVTQVGGVGVVTVHPGS